MIERPEECALCFGVTDLVFYVTNFGSQSDVRCKEHPITNQICYLIVDRDTWLIAGVLSS